MNDHKVEDMAEICGKIETELFVTQKERVDKLPSTRGTKMGRKAAKSKSRARRAADDETVMDSEAQSKMEKVRAEEEGMSAAA